MWLGLSRCRDRMRLETNGICDCEFISEINSHLFASEHVTYTSAILGDMLNLPIQNTNQMKHDETFFYLYIFIFNEEKIGL